MTDQEFLDKIKNAISVAQTARRSRAKEPSYIDDDGFPTAFHDNYDFYDGIVQGLLLANALACDVEKYGIGIGQLKQLQNAAKGEKN